MKSLAEGESKDSIYKALRALIETHEDWAKEEADKN